MLTVVPSVIDNPFKRYGVAMAVTAIGFVLTVKISQMVGHSMFQLAVAAVVISAWYGGLGPGLVSAAMAAVGNAYYLIEPFSSMRVSNLSDMIQLCVFVLVAVLMSGLSEARHQAENKLRSRSEELEAANKELEAFSYSVSHDLRWPLRAIDGYSRILVQEHSAGLSDAARRYLDMIKASANQMDQLVDDLLAFSRLGRQPLRKRATAPEELAQQCLDELKPEQEGRSVTTRIETLPACYADPVLLKQVFVNLLRNALKFTRRREQAIIEVGSQGGPGDIVYFVRDNGVGFNMQYAGKLFGVFERLHRAEDYEGTGVGLAIVQRIIHRHGGKIWAEAEVDKGASFYFSLPDGASND